MATTPICRCRVLYLGSSVPHITKDGLQGIQEPLRDLYPEQGSFSAKGIDSWLSVWSNGLLLENVDESMRQVTRFFNIETLHYCAAVRYVMVPGTNGERVEKFLPLDSPFARHADPNHAPLFACILRRTAGIKVLECHAFICKKEAAANALVRCCFHSYADSMQAKHLEENTYYLENKRSRSMSGLNTLEKVEVWRTNADASNGSTVLPHKTENGDQHDSLNDQDDDNYKVWTGVAPTERELLYVDASGTMKSLKSGSATTRSAQVKVRQMVGPPPRPPPPPSPSLLLNGSKDHKIKNQGKPSKSKNKKQKHHKDGPHMPVNGVVNGFRPPSAMDPYAVPPQSIYGGGFYTERRVRRLGRPPIPGQEEPIYIPSTRPLSPVSSYQPAAFPYEQYFMQYGTAPRGNRFFKGDGKKRHLHPVMPPQPPLPPPPPHEYQPIYIAQPLNSHYQAPSIPIERKSAVPYHAKDIVNGDYHTMRDPRDDSPFNTAMYKRKGRGKGSVNGDDHIVRDESPFNTGVYKRKGKGKEPSNDDETNGDKDDSPFNTGIYKKKGHLNERAFSYSIRQEHRSRSNSLANLHFFTEGDQQNGVPRSSSPPLGGHHQRSRDEDRKERELAQLVSALDIKENGFSSRLDESNRDSIMDANFMRRKTPAY